MLIKIYESYGAVGGGGAKAQPLHPKTLPKKNLLHQSGVSHGVATARARCGKHHGSFRQPA